MDDLVVYESLWGNTAAVAAAIAEGLGEGARAVSTAEATREAVASAGIVVVGAPVHAMSLPTDKSRESARSKPQGSEGLDADLSHPSMRAWLASLPRGGQLAAAFETRIRGPLGRGAASAIAKALSSHGWTLIDEPRGFTVHLKTSSSEPAALLAAGEREAAREWGRRLREVSRSHP